MTDLRAGLARQAPMAIVLCLAALGLGRALTQHWREGAVLLGGALLVAAALRMTLTDERIGMLAVRGRVVDVLCYSGFGLAMLLLAVTITSNNLIAG